MSIGVEDRDDHIVESCIHLNTSQSHAHLEGLRQLVSGQALLLKEHEVIRLSPSLFETLEYTDLDSVVIRDGSWMSGCQKAKR